jgi:hypothetical protein
MIMLMTLLLTSSGNIAASATHVYCIAIPDEHKEQAHLGHHCITLLGAGMAGPMALLEINMQAREKNGRQLPPLQLANAAGHRCATAL